MEEVFRESEAKYRALIEGIPAVTYITDLVTGHTALYVSPQAYQVLGLTPEEIKTDPDFWPRMVHPDDRDRVLAQLAEALRTGEPFVSEYRMVKGDGRVIWVHDEAREVRDETEKPICLQGILFDVTERRQAESLAFSQKDLAVKLGETMELDEAMGLCLGSALAASDMEAGGIYLADARSGDLHMVAHTGLSPEFVASVGYYRRNSPNGEMVHTGKPVYGLHDDYGLTA